MSEHAEEYRCNGCRKLVRDPDGRERCEWVTLPTKNADGEPDGEHPFCMSCAADILDPCEACCEPIFPEQRRCTLTYGYGIAERQQHLHAYCAPKCVLFCAWTCRNAFGGPEEGGWTFEQGELLCAQPVPVIDETPFVFKVAHDALDTAKRNVEAAFPDPRWHAQHRSRDRWVKYTIELAMPEPFFPLETPHYE